MKAHHVRDIGGALLMAALVAATPASAAAPQDEPEDSLASFGEQVTVDVVNVEVWVTDRAGEPVTGLSAEDFALLADGEGIEIRYFAELGSEGEAGGAVPAAGQTPPPSEDDLLRVVLYVDEWNLRPEDRSRALADLREFLARELRPGEEVMVVLHNGAAITIAQDLTADRDELARSLDRVERRATQGINLDSERRQSLREIERSYRSVEEAVEANALLDLDPCVDAWPEMEGAYRSYAAGVAGHAQVSASALASLVQTLAGLPGSKIVLYVGNGLPDQPATDVIEYLRQLCPHRQTEINFFVSDYDLNALYDQVIERANANRVTLYTVEADAPAQAVDSEPTDARFRISAQAVALREGSLESGLTRLADETGGRAILDAADFTPALAGISRDLRHYYSLGFDPPFEDAGATHRLEVRLKGKPGYRVRHRTSFQEKPVEERMMERVQAVAGLAHERNPLEARVESGEGFPADDGLVNVAIRLWMPLERLVLLPRAEGSEGRLRLMLAITEEGRPTGPVRQTIVPVTVGAARDGRPSDAPREKLVEVSLALPPGRHLVAIGVRDELGGEASFLRHRVEVAPP